MRKLLAMLMLCCFTTAATAQQVREILTEEQYYELATMTRKQADTLNLPEWEYIKLLAVNRKVMQPIWAERERSKNRVLAIKEE